VIDKETLESKKRRHGAVGAGAKADPRTGMTGAPDDATTKNKTPPKSTGFVSSLSGAKAPLFFSPSRQAQAASAAFSCTGPESWPLASTSRSTNSITAIGALSP